MHLWLHVLTFGVPCNWCLNVHQNHVCSFYTQSCPIHSMLSNSFKYSENKFSKEHMWIWLFHNAHLLLKTSLLILSTFWEYQIYVPTSMKCWRTFMVVFYRWLGDVHLKHHFSLCLSIFHHHLQILLTTFRCFCCSWVF